jgi:hypothetical protein
MPTRRALSWLALVACTPQADPAQDPSTTSTVADASTIDPSNSDDSAADSLDAAPEDVPSSDFLATPDQGSRSFECDLFAQNCPAGEKCMPWANDGGSAWNSTRCSPIADGAGQEGDACTVAQNHASGIDDCGLGLMCWDVDETGTGYCENMCTGSPENAICEDPHEVCPLSADGLILLCKDTCDPLAQDCPDAQDVCYPYRETWICAPDASGELGLYGDPCEYISACDEGNVCLGAAAFGDCAGAVGCCSALCNVNEEAANAMCAALDPAQSCIPWYQPGLAPPGLESVGVCALP